MKVPYSPPGRFRTAAALDERLAELGIDLRCDRELAGADGPLGQPIDVLGRLLSNRFAIHPMEGWDGTADGLPTEHTLRRWRRFGHSGADLIWGGEAFAVQRDGRANPGQLFLEPAADTLGGLVALREEVRAGRREVGGDPDALLIGLQLTHSGRYARPTAEGPAPRIAYHHPVLDGRLGADEGTPVLTDGELEAIGESYVRSAKLAQEAGFEFVDLKCCHGYLMHELLGARAREGPYGGDFEGRTRFFRRLVDEVRSGCPGLRIGVRASIADVHPFAKHPDTGVGTALGWEEHLPFEHGFGIDADDPRRFDLEEPARFLRLLEELDIGVVNVTLGSPYYCPHLQRPATYPPSDGYLPPEDPLLGVAKHLEVTRWVKRTFPGLVVVGTGYSYLQEYLPHAAEGEVERGGVDLVGLGRMVLSYPELPRDVLRGAPLERRLICRTFSDCTTGPRNGLISGCYPLDPHYKALPEARRLEDIKGERS